MDEDEIIGYLKAVILSHKGGLPIPQLVRDYKDLVGSDIPFRDLGFNTVAELLRSSRDFVVRGIVVDAIPDETQKHLSDLVEGQKSKKTRSRSSRFRAKPSFKRPLSRTPPPYQSRPRPMSPQVNKYAQSSSARPGHSGPQQVSWASPPIYNPNKQSSTTTIIIPQRQRLPASNAGSASSLQSSANQQSNVSKPVSQAHRLAVQPPKIEKEFKTAIEQETAIDASSDKEAKSIPGKSIEPDDNQWISGNDIAPQKLLLKPKLHIEKGMSNNSNLPSPSVERPVRPLPSMGLQRPISRPPPLMDVSPPVSRPPPPLMNQTPVIHSPVIQPPVFQPPVIQPTGLMNRLSMAQQQPLVTRPTPPTFVPTGQNTLPNGNSHQIPAVSPIIRETLPLTAVEKLFDLARELNMEAPRFSVQKKKFKIKDEADCYVGTVTIGRLKFISHNPSSTEEGAREEVTKIAIEDLQEKKRLVDLKKQGQVANNTKLIEIVTNLLKEKPSGIFSSGVASTCVKEHKLVLPDDWLDILKASGQVTVEEAYGNNHILHYNDTPQTTEISVSSLEESLPRSELPNRTLTPSPPLAADTPAMPQAKSISTPYAGHSASISTSNGHGIQELPYLIFPENDVWDVYVTCATSSEVWLRLVGNEYDEVYDRVMTDLEIKLMHGGQKVDQPKVNEYYAVYLNNWLRVQLMSIIAAEETEDNVESAEIFLVDHGDVDVVHLDQLCVLDEEFADLAVQAFQCRLACADIQYNSADVSMFLETKVIGKPFVCKVLDRPTEDTVGSIILYDTSGPGDDVEVNKLLCEKVLSSLKPSKLPNKGGIVEMYLSHISTSGSVYMQICNESLLYLEHVIDDLDLQGIRELAPIPKIMFSSFNVKYLALSAEAPTKWRRAVVTQKIDASKVELKFIDFGYTEIVSVEDTRLISDVYEPLETFPSVVLQVQLQGVPKEKLVEGVVRRIRELAPADQKLFVKVIEGETTEKHAVVELFKRIPPDNIIASINTDIAFNLDRLESEAIKLAEKEKKSIKLRSKRGSPILRKQLPPPCIPDTESFFGVYITLASNPSNFMLQSLKEVEALGRMMTEMQMFYKVESNTHRPSKEEMVEDAVFALRHTDRQWYRVRILTVDHSIASVHFCDYGDIVVVHDNQLCHLDPRFMELPSLAIKAKLAGVKPKGWDWTPEDCVKFQNLVVERSLLAKIMQKSPDVISPKDMVLTVKLLDTSTSEDLDIGDILIKDGRAQAGCR